MSWRTQSSLAVSVDGRQWLLLNASPDLRAQLAVVPALHPREEPSGGGLRHSPIASVLITNGDVDHVAGLLNLRESQPFSIYGTRETLDVIGGNRIFDVVSQDLVPRVALDLDVPREILPGLEVELFAVPGKVPLWLEEGDVAVGTESGATVGAVLSGNGRRMVYVPGCAEAHEGVLARLRGADLLLFDGTLFRDDEMIRSGTGGKTGRRMGHMPMSGPGGTLEVLADLPVARKVFIHINNTNPALIAGSPERGQVEEAGWQIASDAMEFDL